MEKYEALELEIVEFTNADVIETSNFDAGADSIPFHKDAE